MLETNDITIACVAFFAGYLVARLDSIYAALSRREIAGNGGALLAEMREPPVVAAIKKQGQEEIDRKVAAVTIDSSKFVTPINTAEIQKVTAVELGTTTKQTDTLNQSVSKLAQLKGQ